MSLSLSPLCITHTISLYLLSLLRTKCSKSSLSLFSLFFPFSLECTSTQTAKTSFSEFNMATIVGVSLAIPRVLAKASDSPKVQTVNITCLNNPWKRPQFRAQRLFVRPVLAAPDSISDKVAESIKNAEETCSDDPASGECVAAWDEVEELSAAASHARDRKKDSDPLENYCKDNPETDECRTYDN